jgi:hypothetical protein
MQNILMSKFVVKNRQKRKYVRKSEKSSSYSFSKTFYGTLPILIMAVAFMATIIISPSFRNTFSNFKFILHPIQFPVLQIPKLQLPTFSIGNPLLFFQTIIFDINQLNAGLVNIFTALWISLSTFFVASFSATGSAAARNIVIFDPRPLLNTLSSDSATVGYSLFYAGSFVTLYIVDTCKTLLHLSLFSQTTSINEVSFVLSYIVHAISIGFQLILTITSTLLQIIIKTIIFIAQFTTNVAYIVWAMLFRIVTIVWQAIFSIITAIGSWISSVVHAIVHIIEIPFKTLDAFGLAMKPYVDFFGRHVAMTGEDFSNGVSSIGKAASYMSTSK